MRFLRRTNQELPWSVRQTGERRGYRRISQALEHQVRKPQAARCRAGAGRCDRGDGLRAAPGLIRSRNLGAR